MAHGALTLLFLLISAVVAQIKDVNFTLPWGTWQASSYNEDYEYYVFSDIRFAKSPTGDLRFAKPEYPDPIKDPSKIQTGPTRVSCFQVNPNSPCNPGGNLPIGFDPAPEYEIEDCLFFDLYVPKIIYDQAKEDKIAETPVVIWIYGGAYVFGKKNDFTEATPFYNGSASIGTALRYGLDVIYVAGNYRLGALGWLAGETMEKDGQPNAGLYDQRYLIELIKNNIAQVGGNGTDINVWGESAGGGSILHHLVAEWKEPEGPGFQKALLESPAYQWAWDRDDGLEVAFQNFSSSAGCTSGGEIKCLRKVDSSKIYNLNQQFFQSYTPCTGLFNVGPAVDGTLITKLPPVSFQKGEFSKIESIIVSHVDDEAKNFVPQWVQTPAQFEQFVSLFFADASLEPIRDDIEKQYPASGPPYLGDQQARLKALIQDAVFTCNTRQLYNAYKNTSTLLYMEQFSVSNYILETGAFHGLDVMPTFWNADWDLAAYLVSLNLPSIDNNTAPIVANIIGRFSPLYQAYYVSQAITGYPNDLAALSRLPEWKEASDNGNYITNVMNAGILKLSIQPSAADFFNPDYTDTINTQEACGFWDKMAVKVNELDPGLRKSAARSNPDPLDSAEGGDHLTTHDQIPIPGEL